jgi:hypothetical protein
MKRLFVEVFKAYVDRKDERILVPEDPLRAVRGTSVSNSSLFENQMAILLHTHLDDEYRILVDYPIVFPGRNNRITPDILIIRNNTIKMILELKIDLGYEKTGWDNLQMERLHKLKKYQKETGYKPFNVITKEKGPKVFLHVPDKIEYANVIFCQKNGAELIKNVLKDCSNSKCDDREDYPYFILLRNPNIHPNDFTSIDDAAVYIGSMNESDTADWPPFESYLRNRLIFKLT